MSLELCGFWKKEGMQPVGDLYKRLSVFGDCVVVDKRNFVPVRLKSESVSLSWLEDYCEKNGRNVITNHEEVYVCIPKDDLLKAVVLEAEAKK